MIQKYSWNYAFLSFSFFWTGLAQWDWRIMGNYGKNLKASVRVTKNSKKCVKLDISALLTVSFFWKWHTVHANFWKWPIVHANFWSLNILFQPRKIGTTMGHELQPVQMPGPANHKGQLCLIRIKYTPHGTVLESVPSAKYLGFKIPDNLSWSPHIDSISKKANKTWFFLKGISRTIIRTLNPQPIYYIGAATVGICFNSVVPAYSNWYYKKYFMQNIIYTAKIVFIRVLFYWRSFDDKQAHGPHFLT